MKFVGLNEIREKYLSFFESKGHLRLPSFPLVPRNDKSILLINAGMTPLKPYFTGQEVPPRKRVTTCQKCIRTPDIDNVGKTARHGTFFEMLGNFSFGDYFKKEVIPWAWEFLTKELEIPADKLWITIYQDDDEAFDIWTNVVGVPKERIIRMGKEDNFWEHGQGPCGPCSEIHFDRGEEYGCGKPGCTVGCDCDRYMEIWNLVFTQFDKDADGNYNRLPNPNIDTGMGLERLACIMQSVDNLFEVDTIKNIMGYICEIAHVTYGEDDSTDVSLRVITDHIRSTTFMVCDGVLPSNEGRGYVLRRLLRRAARHGKLLNIKEEFLYKVAQKVIAESQSAYPELMEKQDYITKVIRAEEENFDRTIDQGLVMLHDYMEDIKKEGKNTLDGEKAFKLYDTFGFPIDLTREIIAEKGILLDEVGFNEQMAIQKQTSRAALNKEATEAWGDDVYAKLPKDLATEFIGYDKNRCKSEIAAIISGCELAEKASCGEEVQVITNRTVFYAEMGGQVGDIGTITTDSCVMEVTNCTKKGNRFLHIGKIIKGSLSRGDMAEFAINTENRSNIERNHSATHILQKALRNVLGDHVYQSGSYVDAEKLRFDFTHFEAVTKDELLQVEKEANRVILAALPVQIKNMEIEEAKKEGAMALFGEKYSNVVRTVKMGDYSFELCGGCHVKNTATIGLVKILSENGVSSGVRRIEAVTGCGVMDYIYREEEKMTLIAHTLKSSVNEVTDKVRAVVEELKTAHKSIEELNSKLAGSNLDGMLNKAEEMNGITVICASLDDISMDALRALGDQLKDKLEVGYLLLASVNEGKLTFVSMATDSAVKKGVHAGNLVREAAKITGGGGGGKPTSAQAGGKDASKIADAFDAVKEIIKAL